MPLFLSVALGLSAIDTGLRILPLSVTLLLAAVGIPKLFPERVTAAGGAARLPRCCSPASWCCSRPLDVGVGPEIVTWPMLLAGLGIGALASQLGSVTVSAVPDEQSGEVGGLQNTVTNLGASIGTALAGAVLISALTTSFFTGIEDNPAIPEDLSSQAQVELAGGVPFIPDDQLEQALDDAGVTGETADAVVEENAEARLDGLRASLAVLALIALLALFVSPASPPDNPGAVPPPRSRWTPEPISRLPGSPRPQPVGSAARRCRASSAPVAGPRR